MREIVVYGSYEAVGNVYVCGAQHMEFFLFLFAAFDVFSAPMQKNDRAKPPALHKHVIPDRYRLSGRASSQPAVSCVVSSEKSCILTVVLEVQKACVSLHDARCSLHLKASKEREALAQPISAPNLTL